MQTTPRKNRALLLSYPLDKLPVQQGVQAGGLSLHIPAVTLSWCHVLKADWVNVFNTRTCACHCLWSMDVTFLLCLAALRHDGDELLHSPVWGVSGTGCAGTAYLEPSPRLPSREAQVHEHRWSDEVCGL